MAKGKRKRGGQPGHEGRGRSLKPADQVSRFVVSRPHECVHCGALLLGYDPQPSRHQVTELPAIEPEIIEYQVHSLPCVACGQQTRGQWPAAMPTGSFGPRVQATTGYLSGRFGVSHRDIQELMDTFWREEDHSCWLWVASTPKVVLFLLQASRSQQGVMALLGTD